MSRKNNNITRKTRKSTLKANRHPWGPNMRMIQTPVDNSLTNFVRWNPQVATVLNIQVFKKGHNQPTQAFNTPVAKSYGMLVTDMYKNKRLDEWQISAVPMTTELNTIPGQPLWDDTNEIVMTGVGPRPDTQEQLNQIITSMLMVIVKEHKSFIALLEQMDFLPNMKMVCIEYEGAGVIPTGIDLSG